MNPVSNIVARMSKMTEGSKEISPRIRAQVEAQADVSLVSYTDPIDGVSDVSLRIISEEEPSVQQVAIATGRLFNSEVALVPGTLRIANRAVGGVYTITAKATRNIIRVAVADEARLPEHFRCIARNIFLDDRDDLIWNMVEGKNGSKMLIRDALVETDSDLQELLSSFSGDTHQFTKEHHILQDMQAANRSHTTVGTMISYVNHAGENTLAITVIPEKNGKIGVLTQCGEELHMIAASTVSQTFDSDSVADQVKLPSVSSISLSAAPSVDMLVDYYKKIFGMNPDFFREWQSRIRSHQFV